MNKISNYRLKNSENRYFSRAFEVIINKTKHLKDSNLHYIGCEHSTPQKMLKLLIGSTNFNSIIGRCCSTAKENVIQSESEPNSSIYETVFSFPFVKYIATFNRLKVYQLAGTSLAMPGCGLMEVLDVLPQGAFLTAAYIGVTGTALLSLASLPFKNIIGYLYIRVDNQKVKISSVDFWGNRKNRIVNVDDWFPLLDMAPKTMDSLYLTPQLADGTKYKLFIKFGTVLNAQRMGQVLE